MKEPSQSALPGILTADQIVVALYQHFEKRGDWLSFDELRVGTGYGKDAEQRLDFWTMNAIPSQHFRRIAFEIKVSRADFVKELRQPLKRRRALLLSNEFYFIAPRDLIKASELPPEAGLMEIGDVFLGRYDVYIKHPAPWRDTSPPTWQFLASVIRRAKREAGVPEPVS